MTNHLTNSHAFKEASILGSSNASMEVHLSLRFYMPRPELIRLRPEEGLSRCLRSFAGPERRY